MVETDYRQRLEAAENKNQVTRRSVQEILDEEVNKPTFNNHHAETRRHTSLTALVALDEEVKLSVGATDCFHEEYVDLYRAIAALQEQQRWLLRKIFWEGMRQVDIAKQEGVAKTTISDRMRRIYDRLSNFLSR